MPVSKLLQLRDSSEHIRDDRSSTTRRPARSEVALPRKARHRATSLRSAHKRPSSPPFPSSQSSRKEPIITNPSPIHPLLTPLHGGLIVSCQSYPGEPMRDSRTMAQVAASVEAGGALAVRAQGTDDIAAVNAAVRAPVIGIWKDGEEGVFITPTLAHARAVLEAGADVLALDGTTRPRPDGLDLVTTVQAIREDYGDVPIMADCDSVNSALAALDAGVDLIGTTLAGYTEARPKSIGPDLPFIDELVAALPSEFPIAAEGRIHTPGQAREVIDRGAFCAVVGTAITHPTTITTWFADAAREAGLPSCR